MVINRLFISHQHYNYSYIDGYGDAIFRYRSYSRHSKCIYRRPSNSLKFNLQNAIFLTVKGNTPIETLNNTLTSTKGK